VYCMHVYCDVCIYVAFHITPLYISVCVHEYVVMDTTGANNEDGAPDVTIVNAVPIAGEGTAVSSATGSTTSIIFDSGASTSTSSPTQNVYVNEFRIFANKRVVVDIPYEAYDAEGDVISTFGGTATSDSLWKCPICYGMPRRPASIRCCGHTGCEKCLRELLVIAPLVEDLPLGMKPCPMCRTPFTSSDILQYEMWPLIAKHTWQQSVVKCYFCNATSCPKDMKMHELMSCPERRIGCPGCPFTSKIDEMVKHLQECSSIVVNCAQCGYPFHYKRRMLHNCDQLQFYLRTHPEVTLVSGRKGGISYAFVTADDLSLFNDWSPPKLIVVPPPPSDPPMAPLSPVLPPLSPALPPPGYPTLSDVARLSNSSHVGPVRGIRASRLNEQHEDPTRGASSSRGRSRGRGRGRNIFD
jgi:hypothetical protein